LSHSLHLFVPQQSLQASVRQPPMAHGTEKQDGGDFRSNSRTRCPAVQLRVIFAGRA